MTSSSDSPATAEDSEDQGRSASIQEPLILPRALVPGANENGQDRINPNSCTQIPTLNALGLTHLRVPSQPRSLASSRATEASPTALMTSSAVRLSSALGQGSRPQVPKLRGHAPTVGVPPYVRNPGEGMELFRDMDKQGHNRLNLSGKITNFTGQGNSRNMDYTASGMDSHDIMGLSSNPSVAMAASFFLLAIKRAPRTS